MLSKDLSGPLDIFPGHIQMGDSADPIGADGEHEEALLGEPVDQLLRRPELWSDLEDDHIGLHLGRNELQVVDLLDGLSQESGIGVILGQSVDDGPWAIGIIGGLHDTAEIVNP